MPNHYDQGQLGALEVTSQGFLKFGLRATRVGVLFYRQPDGKVSAELRPPEEVFKPESMATLASAPLTNDHPSEDGRPVLLDLDNTKKFMVGFTSDSISNEEDRYLATTATVLDSQSIADIQAGKRQISAGYRCDLDDTEGIWEGQPYNAIQRNIVYNHIALVELGRAGPNVSLRLDQADGIEIQPSTEKPKTMIVKLGDKDYEVPDDFGEAFQEFVASLQKNASGDTDDDDEDDAEDKDSGSKDDDPKKKMDRMQATIDAQNATIKRLKKETKERSDGGGTKDMNARIRARIRLIDVARIIVSSEKHEKLDEMDDLDIKKMVITEEDPDLDLSGKSPEYIDGRFDHVAANYSASHKASASIAKSIKDRRDSGGQKLDAEAARRKQWERAINAWKPTSSGTSGSGR